MRARSAALNRLEAVGLQESCLASRSMSGLSASFPMVVAMESKHVRTVNDRSMAWSLLPYTASCSCRDVIFVASWTDAL